MTSEDEDRAYRRALGGFATGVAIVTVADAAGGFSAITINSFASVSLRPRLVLWSLGCASDRYEAFAAAPGFGINVLAAAQIDLARRFSQQNVASVEPDLVETWNAAPVLRAGLARLGCSIHERRVVGDHLMLIGAVERFSAEPGAGLLYFRGAYGQAAES
ncbi:MAG: flavin reductase [Alphaproteobacteria bacterium]|nr:flavin reductase [Alphaproteobacteria bacterium]